MSITSKICGITTAGTAQAVAEAGASHIGFMFYPPSKRYLPLVDAPALSAATPGMLKRVGVFVDADDKLLEQAINPLRRLPTKLAHQPRGDNAWKVGRT